MHIEIHIFPDHYSINPQEWQSEMMKLMNKLNNMILDGTINNEAYAMGKTTLLADDDSGMVVATLDIRRE